LCGISIIFFMDKNGWLMKTQTSPFEMMRQRPFDRPHSFLERISDKVGWNRFFLREGKRPHIRVDADMLVSPVHGAVAEIQSLAASDRIRGKRRAGATEWYTFEEIIHESEGREEFEGGLCFNLYLAPWNLHYVLFPVDMTVTEISYHPAFCRPIWCMKSGEIKNERLNLRGRMANGVPIIVVLVGSMLVSGVECVAEAGDSYSRGALLGGFKFGSTVLVLLPRDAVEPVVQVKQRILLGEPLGRFIEK
jgi:phosphatidylserine decarboxylase